MQEKKYALRAVTVFTFVFSFASLCLLCHHYSNVLFGDIIVDDTLATVYLIDYKTVGFVSRALIGSIISAFTQKVPNHLIVIIVKAATFVFLLLQSAVAAQATEKIIKLKKYGCLIIVILYLFNPHINYWIFDSSWFGIFDVFNYILFLLFYFCISAKNRALKIFCPLICLAAICVHYQFCVVLLPAAIAMMFYYVFESVPQCASLKDSKAFKIRSALLIFTLITSIALTVYFVLFARRFVKTDPETLYYYMRSRYDGAYIYKRYYDFYLFGQLYGQTYAQSETLKVLRSIVTQSVKFNPYLVRLLTLYLPFTGLWTVLSVRAKPKARKIPYIVILLTVLCLPVGLLLSTDWNRYISAFFMSQFLILLFLIRSEDNELFKFIEKIKKLLLIPVSKIPALNKLRKKIEGSARPVKYLIYALAAIGITVFFYFLFKPGVSITA